MVKVGFLTSTVPIARPRTGTGPIGRPYRVPVISISTVWLPSRRPSTRYSALPVSPAASSFTSSPVPSFPSRPGRATGWIRGDSPRSVFAIRSGSSPVNTTSSVPFGRMISALRSFTTRFESAGAAFPTISMTLKYWFRKPMSPGITTTPGIGGR